MIDTDVCLASPKRETASAIVRVVTDTNSFILASMFVASFSVSG